MLTYSAKYSADSYHYNNITSVSLKHSKSYTKSKR